MRRPMIPTFLTRLAAAGLAVVLFSNSPVLAFLTEGRQDNPRGVAAPAQPEADTLRVCGGSGQSFSSSSALVETINVTGLPDGSAVTAVTVDLNILHGWSGDVVASLGHGSASVGLVNRPGTTNTSFDCDCGCPYDNIAGTFADSATGNADRCVLGVGGVDVANGPYKPIGPGALADFIGSDPNGAWVVTLVDQAVDEAGSLPANGVCLNITYNSPLAVTLADFSAEQVDDVVLSPGKRSASWTTPASTSTAPTTQAARRQLLADMPSQAPGSVQGFAYSYDDLDVRAWPDLVVLAGGRRPDRRDHATRPGQRDGEHADRGDAERHERRRGNRQHDAARHCGLAGAAVAGRRAGCAGASAAKPRIIRKTRIGLRHPRIPANPRFSLTGEPIRRDGILRVCRQTRCDAQD